jgi:hypothetical protein
MCGVIVPQFAGTVKVELAVYCSRQLEIRVLVMLGMGSFNNPAVRIRDSR